MEKEIANLLRQWLKEQSPPKTIRQLSRESEIPYNSLRWITGGGRRPNPKEMQKLYRATGLDYFKLTEKKIPPAHKPVPREPVKAKKKPFRRLRYQLPPKQLNELKATLEILSDVPEILTEALSNLEDIRNSILASNTRPRYTAVEDRIKNISNLLVLLNQELQFFKRGSPETRAKLRRLLSGSDVGYITALLRALFDEDRFQNWMLMSTYRMETNR